MRFTGNSWCRIRDRLLIIDKHLPLLSENLLLHLLVNLRKSNLMAAIFYGLQTECPL